MNLIKELNESITALGSGYFNILILVILFRFNVSLFFKLLLLLLTGEIICGGIKLIYNKSRPIPRSNRTLYQRWDAGSFPSLHTSRVVIIAVVLNNAFFDPLISIFSAFLVAGVGYSRIYLKKHYLTDVIAGFFIGLIIGIGGIIL